MPIGAHPQPERAAGHEFQPAEASSHKAGNHMAIDAAIVKTLAHDPSSLPDLARLLKAPQKRTEEAFGIELLMRVLLSGHGATFWSHYCSAYKSAPNAIAPTRAELTIMSAMQAVAPPPNNPAKLTELVDYDLFKVRYDARGRIYIDFLKTHSPLRYACGVFHGAPVNLESPRMLPMQATGSCYFHAVMNMVMNNKVFCAAYLAHIVADVRSNKFSRLPHESEVQARSRRCAKARDYQLTFGRDAFDATKTNVRAMLDDVANCPELYRWARHVILYHMIVAAVNRAARKLPLDQRRNRADDAQAALLIKQAEALDWHKDKYKAALRHVGHGGRPLEAVKDIFTLSGLQVKYCMGGGAMGLGGVEGALVARIKSNGVALCLHVGGKTDATPLPHDASETGLYLHCYRNAGHAMATVRAPNNGDYRILDSNGFRDSIEEVIGRYGKPTHAFYGAAYACRLPAWPYGTAEPDPLASPSFRAAMMFQTNAAADDADSAAAPLAPESSDASDECAPTSSDEDAPASSDEDEFTTVADLQDALTVFNEYVEANIVEDGQLESNASDDDSALDSADVPSLARAALSDVVFLMSGLSGA